MIPGLKKAALRLFYTGAFLAPSLALVTAAFSRDCAASEAGSSRIEQAIELLQTTPTGRQIVANGMKTWKLSSPAELAKVLRASSVSRTDAVLTRHYNAWTGAETRERLVTVYLRQDQSIASMALDLAHELVHATSRPAWDPYDPNLTAGIYIENAIEGKGGEVQAVRTECQVASELARGKGPLLHHCDAYLDPKHPGEGPNLARITADFYRVGQWGPYLERSLGPEIKLFPLLSDEAPRLYSSTGNAPYPAALLREFQILTRIACENSKRRATLAESRSIASAPARRIHDAFSSGSGKDQTFRFLERRCQ